MYIPRGWHFAYPTALILIGFYLHEHFGGAWDVVLFVNLPLGAIAVEWARYIHDAGVMYQAYVTGAPKPAAAAPKVEKSESLDPSFIPIVRPITNLNQQAVDMPAFSFERRFAIDMLRMYDFDPVTQKHVNATETLWVKTKKAVGQAALKNLKEKWVCFGLFKRENENRNARYIVDDRRKVALVAAGNPLPDWVPPPPST